MAALLDDFRCRRDGDFLEVICPASIAGPANAEDFASDPCRRSVRRFAGRSLSDGILEAARHFSAIHGYPEPLPARYRAPAAPEISCVIVLHRNVHFVRELLIPSLLHASEGHAVEIIVVSNGAVADLPDAVTVVETPDHSVSRAYNLGVANARAATLALFHDDCLLDDPAWIAKVEAAWRAGADALSPEIRRLDTAGGIAIAPLPVLKNVPLVLRRGVFESVGGYDEELYLGYEDIDFTLRLLDAGYRTARLGLGYRHFGGMSSCLKYLDRPGLDLLFATLAVPAANILEAFAAFVRDARSEAAALLSAMNAVQLHAVLDRHRERLDAGPVTAARLLDAVLDSGAGRARMSSQELLSVSLPSLDARVVELCRSPVQ